MSLRKNHNLYKKFFYGSRAGRDAYLSLGNKKGVDIVVTAPNNTYALLEVKGVNENMDWLIGNTGSFRSEPNLFYALVTFGGKISDINHPANFYIIPSELLKSLTEHKIAGNEKTVYLSHKYIREKYGDFQNTFKSLNEYLDNIPNLSDILEKPLVQN